jgi:hypothetical protein
MKDEEDTETQQKLKNLFQCLADEAEEGDFETEPVVD